MAQKKQKEASICSKMIDYNLIVDELSDSAFRFCVSQLFPLLNYHILQPSDVRKIDLKEKLFDLTTVTPKAAKAEQKGTCNYYLYAIKMYFDSMFSCEENSRAAKFKARGYASIETALSENGELNDVDDVFLVFLSMYREYIKHQASDKKFLIKDLFFTAEMDDAEAIGRIPENRDLLPDGFIKNGLFEKTLNNDSKYAIKTLHMNNILFLCRALQNFGWFAEENA